MRSHAERGNEERISGWYSPPEARAQVDTPTWTKLITGSGGVPQARPVMPIARATRPDRRKPLDWIIGRFFDSRRTYRIARLSSEMPFPVLAGP